MQQKEIFPKGKRLSYQTIGEGTTIVLVHGFGETGAIWKNQVQAFPGFKLIVPDLPGSGASEPVADMSMEGQAAVLKDLIVHENAALFYKSGEPDSVIMIGHSMGGYITLAFAELFPQMLKGFGLFHSTAFADSEEKKQHRQKGIEFIELHGAYPFLKTSLPNLYSHYTKEKNPAFIEQHLESVKNFSAASLTAYYHAMMQRPNRTKVLQTASVPVLIIFGKEDTAVPLHENLPLAHLANLSYIHILENSGHMGMIEERVEANRILSEYFNSFEITVLPE